MASEKKFIIDVDPKGGMSVEGDGFKDATCLKELEKMAQGMGADILDLQKKPEAYVNTPATQKIGSY